jgi:hypothetical protein
MLGTNLSDISDIHRLRDNRVLERRFLDFKEKAIGSGDGEKARIS